MAEINDLTSEVFANHTKEEVSRYVALEAKRVRANISRAKTDIEYIAVLVDAKTLCLDVEKLNQIINPPDTSGVGDML